jgi:hypothetical protein
MTDDLPNFAEAEIEDIWRYYAEHADSRAFHDVRAKHAKLAILERLRDKGARIMKCEWGDIVAEYSNEYSYSTPVVDGDFMKLIAEDELYDEFERFAKKNYKINRPWLKRLEKRGDKWRDTIERMTQASTGTPTLRGPSLADMGYTPEQVKEEAYAN